jgi:hypothetical protein
LSLMEIKACNHCCMYFRVLYLSDIVSGVGLTILDSPWNGIRDESFHQETWPNFGNPPRTMWNVWRQALKTAFLGRGRRLKQPLGRWFHLDPAQSWLLDRDKSLYQLCDGKWSYHCPLLRRQHLPAFAVIGRPCQAPPEPLS